MRAIHRLRFHCRVPPWIEYKDVFGCGEVQAEAASLQAYQECTAVFFGLKTFHPLLTIASRSVEILVVDCVSIQAIPHDFQKTGELREHQRLVSLIEDLAELFQQQLELCTGLADPLRTQQAGMASSLP